MRKALLSLAFALFVSCTVTPLPAQEAEPNTTIIFKKEMDEQTAERIRERFRAAELHNTKVGGIVASRWWQDETVVLYDEETEERTEPMPLGRAKALREANPHYVIVLRDQFGTFNLPTVTRRFYEDRPTKLVEGK